MPIPLGIVNQELPSDYFDALSAGYSAEEEGDWLRIAVAKRIGFLFALAAVHNVEHRATFTFAKRTLRAWKTHFSCGSTQASGIPHRIILNF